MLYSTFALFCDKCAVLNSTMYECYDVCIVLVKRLEAEQNKSKVIKLIRYEQCQGGFMLSLRLKVTMNETLKV